MTGHRTRDSVVFPHSSGVPVRTLPEAFQATAAARPQGTAIRSHDGQWQLTWREYAERVREIADGLAGLPLRHGETLGIMLGNCPEFHLVDTAALHLGLTPFSIYTTLPAHQVAAICRNAGSRVIVTERRFLPVIRDTGLGFAAVICVDGAPRGTRSLASLIESRSTSMDFEARWRSVTPNDLATISYTSGTTGQPKGVELTHANILAQLRGLGEHLPVGRADRILSYLPAAHIADRVTAHYAGMVRGVQVATVPDPAELAVAVVAVRPTILFGVPRVWQKIKSRIESGIDTRSAVVRRTGHWALRTGAAAVRADAAGTPRGAALSLRYGLARALVLRPILRAAGLDEVRFAASGAAPIPVETVEFFHALGIRLTQVWGLTEATGVSTTTTPAAPATGAVGRPLAGVELGLGADGEIMLRGATVTRGYHGDPEATGAVLDHEGWLHTGDLGELTPGGDLRIIGRKSEMLIDDGGRNIAPAGIENAVKARSYLIGEVMVIGDRRPYVTALITLDESAIAADADQGSFEPATVDVLVQRPGIRAAITEAVAAANATVAPPERIRRFLLLDHVWQPGGGEMTPKHTLRRARILQHYGAEIALLYRDRVVEPVIGLTDVPAQGAGGGRHRGTVRR